MLNVFKSPNAKNIYIERALRVSEFRCLTLEEFVIRTGYPVDQFMIDNFFHNLDKDINLYITPKFLEYFGYTGALKTQKTNFMRMLDSNFTEGVDYWVLDNKGYQIHYQEISKIIAENFESENLSIHVDAQNPQSGDTKQPDPIKPPEFPDPSKFIGVNGKATTKHVILTVHCFKKFLMMLNTKKANNIREFYLMLEQLIRDYTKYQNLYLQTDGAKKDARIDALIADLRNSNKETAASRQALEKATEELFENRQELSKSRKELSDTRKELAYTNRMLEDSHEDLLVTEEVLGEKIDNISRKLDRAVEDRVVRPEEPAKLEHFALFALRDPNSEFTHKVARVRGTNFTRAKNNITQQFPKAEMVLHLEATPNAKALYDNIRDKIRGPVYRSLYISLGEDWTEDSFVAKIREVYEEKREVDLAA